MKTILLVSKTAAVMSRFWATKHYLRNLINAKLAKVLLRKYTSMEIPSGVRRPGKHFTARENTARNRAIFSVPRSVGG